MKKIKLGTITLATCLLLIGCDNSKISDNSSKVSDSNLYKSNQIKDINGNNITTTEYIDKSTRVHYLIVQEYQNTLSVTPMYNADGTLKTSE